MAAFRQQFSDEINMMQKDLSAADAAYDRLPKLDVLPWCPPEIASVPVIREYCGHLISVVTAL